MRVFKGKVEGFRPACLYVPYTTLRMALVEGARKATIKKNTQRKERK